MISCIISDPEKYFKFLNLVESVRRWVFWITVVSSIVIFGSIVSAQSYQQISNDRGLTVEYDMSEFSLLYDEGYTFTFGERDTVGIVLHLTLSDILGQNGSQLNIGTGWNVFYMRQELYLGIDVTVGIKYRNGYVFYLSI